MSPGQSPWFLVPLLGVFMAAWWVNSFRPRLTPGSNGVPEAVARNGPPGCGCKNEAEFGPLILILAIPLNETVRLPSFADSP